MDRSTHHKNPEISNGAFNCVIMAQGVDMNLKIASFYVQLISGIEFHCSGPAPGWRMLDSYQKSFFSPSFWDVFGFTFFK